MAISSIHLSAARKALLAMRVTGIVRCVNLVCIMCIFTSALELAAAGVEGCRREEREALVSLQRHIEPLQIYVGSAERYPTVPVLAQWPAGGDGDCCEWQGVSCNADGRVEVLALNYIDRTYIDYAIDCSRTSPLPSLSSLQSLRVLDLAGYSDCFSGGIPAAWRSSFRNLTHLDLSGNLWLYTTTSPWYSSLPNTLTYLNLSNTGFELDDAGYHSVFDLSQLLRHMPHLTHLDLSSNFLGGPLIAPDHKALRGSLLRYLDLSWNSFSGRIPEELGSLQRLAYLDLSGNYFSGRIPAGLGSLQRLAYLDLSWNQIQNPVPWQHLGNLSNLEHLSLGNRIHSKVETLLWDAIPSTGVGEGPGGKQCNWLKLHSLGCHNVAFRTSSSAFCLDDPAVTSRLTDLFLPDSPTMTSINFLFHTLLPNASSLESLFLHLEMDLIKKLPLLPPLPFLKSLSISSNSQLTEFPSWLAQQPPPLIESLDLSLNNLTGPIPSWVAELPNLKFLDMSSNSLGGPIPPSLTNLSELLELDLAENNLAGQVPSFQSKNLEHLDLGSNLLTGPLPVGGLESLKRLRYMDLSSNSFTGSLPDNMAENWTLSLVSFDLSGNNLTGRIPSSFSNARHLLHIDLSHNQLTGNIPFSLGNASQLQHLGLDYNQLTGCIPSSLGQIGQFQSRYLLGAVDLFLSHNYLSCDFPGSLVFLPYKTIQFSIDASNNHLTSWRSIPDHHDANNSSENLRFYNLDLSYNALRGEMPSWMRNTPALEIDLSHNFLSGSLASLSLNNSIFLDLSNNNFSGRLPAHIGHRSPMSLQFDHNHFSGEIPASLTSACENLRILTLSSNELTGIIPPATIQNCSSLMVLDLSNNILSGEGTLAWMANNTFPQLRVLMLSNNRLEGNISSSLIRSLPSVQILMLRNNHLSGTIPSNLNELKHMVFPRKVRSEETYITLTIPIKGTNRQLKYVLPELTLLDFSRNHLEGGIPVQIGALKGLQNLDLSHNGIRGPIPRRMGMMAALESLDLSHNFLEGRIPPELCSLSSLEVLNLASNYLQGPAIPASSCTQFTTFDESTFANNDGLCGPPLSKKCLSSSNGILTPADHTSAPRDDNYQVLVELQNVMSLEAFAIGYCIGIVLIIALLYWCKHPS